MQGSLQMEANVGGASTIAVWSELAGGGSLTASGLFTAGNELSGAGAIPIVGSIGANSASGVIAVTGAFPGVISEQGLSFYLVH